LLGCTEADMAVNADTAREHELVGVPTPRI
jgi:hypothetical protein